MMQRSQKKISLTRETVRLLTDDEAKAAVGGGVSQNTCNNVCGFSKPTVCLTGMWCLDSVACP
ncbi:MAG TPA: hypothetical protein VGQ42_12865 [Candidatus Dormibacteraeota bacterium]|nr:hypothetical protein [Candidatus Dormibacteraeota bacterium]